MKRDYNKAAHILAQYARQKEESYVWEGVCPPMVAQVIQEEEMKLLLFFCLSLSLGFVVLYYLC